MGLVLSLGGVGLLSLLGLSSLLDSEKVNVSSIGGASLDSDAIIENSKDFVEKYQLDTITTDKSEQPYISSNEMFRPNYPYKNDDKKISGKALATSFLAGATVSALADDEIKSTVNWLLVAVLGVGGIWIYKELTK